MGKISRCFITLDGEKEVYRHGEMVRGTVGLQVVESFKLRSVRIYLYGEALVKWDPVFEKKENVAREKYIGHYVHLFGNRANESSNPHVTLSAGKQNYKFSFRLPNGGLPSSFEGEYGAVRYWLKVVVDKPTFSFNENWWRCFTVVEELDVNKPGYKVPIRRGQEKTVSKALGFGNAGTLVLNAECDRKAYCPGEKIALNVLVKNNTTKDMGKLKARLIQTCEFKANGDSKTSDSYIRIIEGESSIAAGQERKWENQMLSIDALPPSSTNISCHIIDVSYYVKVWVEVPWGLDLSVHMPITIGTIPLKQNTTPQPVGAASNTFEIDTTKSLCYSKCNHGIMHCGSSYGIFVNMRYVPMCVYVPNYQFTPKAAAQPKAVPVKSVRPPNVSTTRTAVPAPVRPPATNVPVNNRVRPVAPTAANIPGNSRIRSTAPPACNIPVNSPPVLPPSYEEVLQMDSQKAKPEAAAVCEIPKSDRIGLFIRFPDAHIVEFRSYILKNRQYLKEKEGELLALSVQPMSDFGIWPDQTSIAIFLFPSAEKASDWFKTAPCINETSWIKSCDATTIKMNKVHNENYRYFGISYTSIINAGKNIKGRKELGRVVREVITPYRIQNGGISLATAQAIDVLQGDWISRPWYITLSQWPSLKGYSEFRRFISQVKEYENEKRKYYNIVAPIVFQTEDISPYLESGMPDDTTGDNSENDANNDETMDVTAENQADNADTSDVTEINPNSEIVTEDVSGGEP